MAAGGSDHDPQDDEGHGCELALERVFELDCNFKAGIRLSRRPASWKSTHFIPCSADCSTWLDFVKTALGANEKKLMEFQVRVA